MLHSEHVAYSDSDKTAGHTGWKVLQLGLGDAFYQF